MEKTVDEMRTGGFYGFMDIMRILKSPEGCPWDREQTHASLRQSLLEESYELADAVDRADTKNLCEELGDLLMLICLHAAIAEENGEFTIDDVISSAAEKMIFRHPHVFKEKDPSMNTEELLVKWEELKKEEKKEKDVSESMLRIARALPANIRAEKVQKKAAKVGMDFESTEQIMEKCCEEWQELKEAHEKRNQEQIFEEFGDLMFSIINLSRFFQINAENSLTNATEKFINRFVSVENLAKRGNKPMSQMSAGELDKLWRVAKNQK